MPNPGEGGPADKQAFIDEMSTEISHVLDNPGELWTEQGVVSQPTMVFVAADGTIEKHTGSLGPQGLLERVKTLATS